MIKKILMGLFATVVTSSVSAEDKWEVYSAEDNGYPLIVRLRSTIPEAVVPSLYPHMIAITWKYESESGMPSDSEKKSMDDLEDSITEAVEPNNYGFLTVVVTGNQVREWQFYSKNTDEFMGLLNQALAGKPVFPIQISLQNDPDWAAYKQFTKNGT